MSSGLRFTVQSMEAQTSLVFDPVEVACLVTCTHIASNDCEPAGATLTLPHEAVEQYSRPDRSTLVPAANRR